MASMEIVGAGGGFTFDYWRRTRRVRLRAYATRALAHDQSLPTESISSFPAAI
jgi:hypothetical protein